MEEYDYALEEQIERVKFLERELKNKEYELSELKDILNKTNDALKESVSSLDETQLSFSSAIVCALTFFTFSIFPPKNAVISLIELLHDAFVFPSFETVFNTLAIPCSFLGLGIGWFIFGCLLAGLCASMQLLLKRFPQRHFLDHEFYSEWRSTIFCALFSFISSFILYAIVHPG